MLTPWAPHKGAPLQIRDLSRGAYGCVVLALNTQTGQQVALKFIERGKEVTQAAQTLSLASQVLSVPPSLPLARQAAA